MNLQVIILLFIILILLFLFSFFLTAIVSYWIYLYYKKKIFNYEIRDYNKKTKKLLQKYGKWKLHRVFLIQKPIDVLFQKGMEWIYKTDISTYYHMGILVELKHNGNNKLLFIEKNEGIYIYENFPILDSYEIHLSKLVKNKITFEKMMNQTKIGMGEKKYFNWNIIHNNCQHFSFELLKSLGINIDKKFSQLCQSWPDFEINEKTFIHYFFLFFVECFTFANYF